MWLFHHLDRRPCPTHSKRSPPPRARPGMPPSCHDGWMKRAAMTVTAALLVGAGVMGATVFLTSEGLDRAEKWVSISGVIVSVALGVGGLVLAWLSLRLVRANPPAAVVPPSLPATAPPTPSHLDASQAKGVQIGDHNTQHNTFQ